MPAQKTEKAESKEKGLTYEKKKSQKPRPSNKDCPRIQNSLGEFVCQQLKLNKRTKQRRLWRKKEKKTGEEVGYSDCSQHHVSWPHVVYNSLEGPGHGHNYASLCRWGSRGWGAESICPCHTANMWKKYAQNSRDFLRSFCFSEFPEVCRAESWRFD